MNRRGFLSALIAAGTAAAIDPERLLWTPGKKLVSIPSYRRGPFRVGVDFSTDIPFFSPYHQGVIAIANRLVLADRYLVPAIEALSLHAGRKLSIADCSVRSAYNVLAPPTTTPYLWSVTYSNEKGFKPGWMIDR